MSDSDPMDLNLPGSFVHGILQPRMLEWAAMPSSRRHKVLRDPAPKAATLLTPEGIGHNGYIAKCNSGVSPATALTLLWGGLMLLVQDGLYPGFQ